MQTKRTTKIAKKIERFKREIICNAPQNPESFFNFYLEPQP